MRFQSRLRILLSLLPVIGGGCGAEPESPRGPAASQSSAARSASTIAAAPATTTSPVRLVDQVTSQPVTVRVTLTPEARAAIDRAALSAGTTLPTPTTSPVVPDINLTIERARPVQARGIMLRVFLNNPTANAKTATTDASYVGSISFFPAAGPQTGQPGDYMLNLAPALRRLAAQKKVDLSGSLEVTLVPASIRGEHVPSETRIRFSDIKADVTKQQR